MSEIKQVCTCEHCGSEAEMIITCKLPQADIVKAKVVPTAAASQPQSAIKGTAVCTSCGGEADIWLDVAE